MASRDIVTILLVLCRGWLAIAEYLRRIYEGTEIRRITPGGWGSPSNSS